MGRMTIDSASLRLDDRVLAHLEVVIVTKLRRGEPFAFTWSHGVEVGGGREAKWVHPACDIDFRFDGRGPERINPRWVEALLSAANSPSGLRMLPEPGTDDE